MVSAVVDPAAKVLSATITIPSNRGLGEPCPLCPPAARAGLLLLPYAGAAFTYLGAPSPMPRPPAGSPSLHLTCPPCAAVITNYELVGTPDGGATQQIPLVTVTGTGTLKGTVVSRLVQRKV